MNAVYRKFQFDRIFRRKTIVTYFKYKDVHKWRAKQNLVTFL